MKPLGAPVAEHELHAFADGWLEGERRAAVIDYLGAHPEATSRVLGWQRQNQAIRQAFAPLDPARAGWRAEGEAANVLALRRPPQRGAPPPQTERPLPAIRGDRPRAPLHGRPFGLRLARSFGASALVAGGMFIGAVTLIYTANGLTPLSSPARTPVEAAAEPAFAAWRGLALGTERTPAPGARFSAAAAAWLAGPQSLSLRAPGGNEFFDFSGARRGGGEVLLTYQSGAGRRLTLTLAPAETTANSPLRLQRDRDLSLVTWHDAGVAYTLVGPLGGEAMLGLARALNADVQGARR